MKRSLCASFVFIAVASLLAIASAPRNAYADAGDAGDAEAGSDAAELVDGGSGESTAPPVPVACDGSLCDTTNASTCTASGATGNAPFEPMSVTLVLGVMATAIARRLRAERHDA